MCCGLLAWFAVGAPCAAQEADAGADDESPAIGVSAKARGAISAELRAAFMRHEATLGFMHPETLALADKLARAYRAERRFASALELALRMLGAAERMHGAEHVQSAEAQMLISLLYQDLADLETAAAYGQRALRIREQAFGTEHPATAVIASQLAGTYRQMGRYEQALPLYERALAIKEKTQGSDHPAVATTLNSLGLLYRNTGHYQKALPIYQRALAISERASGADSAVTAIRLQNLAEVYRALGRADLALPLYRRALEIRERRLDPDHPRLAITLNNLARLLEDMEQSEQALPLLERALAIRQKAFGAAHPVTAVTLAALADLHLREKRHQEALAMYRQALEIRASRLGAAHALTAHSHADVGKALQALGESDQALAHYLEAQAVAEKAGNPEVLWKTQDGLRALLAARGWHAAAIVMGKQAVNTLQGMRSRIAELEQETRKAFVNSKQQVYRQLADLLFDQGRYAEAQQVLGMLKEEEFFDFVRRDAGDDQRAMRAALTVPEQAWQAQWERLREQGLAATDKAGAMRAALAEHAGALSAPTLAQQASRQDAARNAVQEQLARLGHGAVLLHYLVTDNKVRILLTSPGGQVARDSPLGAAQLGRRIAAFREQLQHPGRDPRPLGRILYQALIAPVAPDLERVNAKTLMLSLDGAMRYLPMAALYDGQDYLVQRYALALYTDAAAPRLGERSLGKWRMAGLGLTRSVDGFSALPAVKEEINGILRGTGVAGEAYFDHAFTDARLRQSLAGRHAVLHISSHFVFRPGTDTDSFLLLGDGSRLSLRDIRERRYDFRRLDLLTLSACDTAMGGSDASGREVEGLGVLAQRQGAKGVLATLWPVADHSTSVLMREMYRIRQRQAGTTTAEALRQAQLALLAGPQAAKAAPSRGVRLQPEAGGERQSPAMHAMPAMPAGYAHPYYWAPFILMGNWL